jgi:hypothetical protein
MTKVVNCNREKFDVHIGRPSKWGNPFIIGRDGTRKEVIEKYRTWIQTQPELMVDIKSLRDKTLGCYCKPLDVMETFWLSLLIVDTWEHIKCL